MKLISSVTSNDLKVGWLMSGSQGDLYESLPYVVFYLIMCSTNILLLLLFLLRESHVEGEARSMWSIHIWWRSPI